jgi:Spy/CpxP family protein refolding chaperone
MPKYKKNLLNPNLYGQFQSPSDRYKFTNAQFMDGFYNQAMATATDGQFDAYCLSGIRTEDNTGAGTDANDAYLDPFGYVWIVVYPDTNIARPADPRAFTNPKDIVDSVGGFKAAGFWVRSNYLAHGKSAPAFGQKLSMYFEEGSISNSDWSRARFTEPTGLPDYGDGSFLKLASVEGLASAQAAFALGNASLLGTQQATTQSTNPMQQAFENKLGAAIRGLGLKFKVTDRSRTVDDQVNRIMNKYTGNGKQEVISTYGKTRGAKMVAAIESGDMATLKTLASQSSKHLKGAAIDIRSWHYNDEEMTLVLAEIRKLGGNPLVEPISGNCWEKSGRNVINAKRNGKPGGAKGAVCYNEHIHIDIPEV